MGDGLDLDEGGLLSRPKNEEDEELFSSVVVVVVAVPVAAVAVVVVVPLAGLDSVAGGAPKASSKEAKPEVGFAFNFGLKKYYVETLNHRLFHELGSE